MKRRIWQSGIYSAAILGAASTAVNGGAALLRSKAVALSLGPTGVGIVSEVQQLLTLLSVPVAALSGAALTRRLVDAKQASIQNVVEQTRSAATTAAATTLLATIVAVALSSFALQLPYSTIAATVFVAGVAAVATATLGVYAQSLLVCANLERSFATTSINTLAGALLGVLGLWQFGLVGLFAGPLVASTLMFVVAVRQCRAAIYKANWWPSFTVDKAYIALAIRVGTASLVGTLATQLALSGIRLRLLAAGGHGSNGMFQAAWALDSLFMSALTSGVASYFFPRFAEAREGEPLRQEVSRAMQFVVSIGPIILLAINSGRMLLVRLAYSDSFSESATLLGLLLVGDMMRLGGWIYAAPLLYRNKLRSFIITDVSAAATLGIISIILIPIYNIIGIGLAQIAMYAVYVFLTRYHCSLQFGIDLGRLPLISIFGTATLLLALWTLSGYFSFVWAVSALLSFGLLVTRVVQNRRAHHNTRQL